MIDLDKFTGKTAVIVAVTKAFVGTGRVAPLAVRIAVGVCAVVVI